MAHASVLSYRKEHIMETIPWFAWIAIIAIIVWGVLSVINTLSQRTSDRAANHSENEEIELLKRRVEDLEYRFNHRD